MVEHALTCINHPDQGTSLRCNKCERPICVRCANQTPVGYRCSECLRGQQAVFDTALGYDHAVAFAIGALGVGAATYLLGFIGAWGIFLAPVLGAMLASVIRASMRGRRGLNIPIASAIGGGLGALVNLGFVIGTILSAYGGQGSLMISSRLVFTLLWPLAHGLILAAAMFYRLKALRY